MEATDYAVHGSLARCASFATVPTEIQLKIWSHAVEPRIILLNDVLSVPQAYSLPGVTQVNVEARSECRAGYDVVGRGSYFHSLKDILVCDHFPLDEASDDLLEDLAPRIQRLAFWDCIPDDGALANPWAYQQHLHHLYGRKTLGKIEVDKLWYPNLKELWIVKIGDVDPSWGIRRDRTASPAAQLRQLARQFRYWVDEGVVEMSTLDPNNSDTKLVLKEGRCRRGDCRELDRDRPMMVSRVLFMDGKYRNTGPSADRWVRIVPENTEAPSQVRQQTEWRMRWALAERMLVCSLRWEGADDSEGAVNRRNRSACDRTN